MLKLIAIAGAAIALSAAVVNKADAVAYIFTEAPRYDAKAWMGGRDRFPAGAALKLAGGRAVVPNFYASADASVLFDATHILFSGKKNLTARWQIWETALTNGSPRQITSGDTDCVRPFYLPEDRIVYTRVGRAESWIESTPLVGGKPSRLSFVPMRYLTDDVLRDGRILFEAGTNARELYTVYPDGTGVEAVRCDHGPDRGSGRQLASHDIIFETIDGLARFTSSKAVQFDDLRNASGPIAEISDEQWIVGRRAKSGGVGLYRWDLGSKQFAALEVASLNAVEPVIVAPRIAPTRFPSGLVTTRTAGNLLCLNARVSREPMPAGEIHKVRLYSQEGMLGETEVERDGSFYVQVPADRAIRMELLDAAGHVLRAEHNWFWMRPSEQRVCVGCHAGPERSPENKVPEILLKTTTPVKMLEAKR
ncbi:MAG: hypothetical protein ABSH09_03730 [Bryobacteraceae bacterium]